MTTAATIIRSSAAVLLVGTGYALAQEPPAPTYGSDPANYVSALAAARDAKVVEPGGPVQPERGWDGEKPFLPDMHAPVFPDAVLPQDVLEAMRPAALAAFNLFDASVQEIAPIDHDGEKLVAINLPEGLRLVRLHEYAMRDPDAQLKVQVAGGRIIDAVWPAPTTYRGTIDGAPEYEVAASILDDKVSLFIMPVVEDLAAWYLQPICDGLAGAPRGVHVLYRDVDVIPSGFECGVGLDGFDIPAPDEPPLNGPVALARRTPVIADNVKEEDHAGPGGAPGSSNSSGGGPLAVANVRCQIALDADYEYFLASGSSVLATIYEMERLFNFVGLNYQGQVGISYTETFIIIRTDINDPYTTGQTGSAMRDQFRDHWIANHAGVSRDVAHLFSNRSATDGFIGFAYFAGICNANNGANSGYEWSGTYYSPLLADRVGLVSHELGHVWNACHCNQQSCTGSATVDADCGIMNSSITGSWTFGTRAVNAIIAHRDSRNCLDLWYNPTYVNWAYGGVETGSITQPWNTIFEGLDACLVGGTLNVAGGNYFQNPNIFKAKNIFTTGGTVRIGSN